MKQRRTWGVSEQKRTAASQAWKCAHCLCVLPPEFELDHIIPLFEGGPDNYETNSQALCPNCHARKTQLERIRKREREKLQREHEVQAAWEAHVETVDTEERRRRTDTRLGKGQLRCNLCNITYFEIFKHDCVVVAQRIESRLRVGESSSKGQSKQRHPVAILDRENNADGSSNPFLCYEYIEFKPRVLNRTTARE